jgi:hypothetical protein
MNRRNLDDIKRRDIAALCGGIIGTIAAFDQRTLIDSYTDTGEAWEILRAVQSDARKILRKVRA